MPKKEKIATEDKVLEAALQEFAGHGFDGARVDRIAARAKVNKAMIYYHFKSKEALYERILNNLFQGIYGYVKSIMPSEGSPLDALYTILENYIVYIHGLDRSFIRVMIREISSGGKYFRKVGIPVLLTPMMELIIPLIERSKAEGLIRDIKPYYTMLQIVGGVVFFNLFRITTEGADIHGVLFHENHLQEFKENFMGILKHGIEKREEPA
ncbi:MAG: TetR/AcrR family transcriptional regulator [Spirochaetes bacterium]|nr:MAG: TetR/AcrR family transcriptional regulator [Spirochaetota bacterium]